MLQLVAALGIVPNLIPGVGLALEKRSAFFHCLQLKSDDIKADPEKGYKRLVHATSSLLSFMEDKQLSGMFLTKHLGDLLAALIQLGYAPLKKPDSDNPPKPGSAFVMTQEKYDRLMAEQKAFREQLNDLMERVYQPLVVKYLLIVQSSGSSAKANAKSDSGPVAPKWLKNACGELLSGRLMRKHGVRNVIR